MGRTALSVAYTLGNMDMIKVLVRHVPKRPLRLIQQIWQSRNWELLQFVLDCAAGCEMDAFINNHHFFNGELLLIEAVRSGQYKQLVEALRKVGAKADAMNVKGVSAISLAIEQKNYEMVKLLMAGSSTRRIKFDLLWFATCTRDAVGSIYFLIEHRAIPGLEDSFWDVKDAIREGKMSVVKGLLALGIAEPNLLFREACRMEQCDIAKMLVSLGADLNIEVPPSMRPCIAQEARDYRSSVWETGILGFGDTSSALGKLTNNPIVEIQVLSIVKPMVTLGDEWSFTDEQE
eukprot:TRINITY_DN3812_c0_g1_i3.p1 TRINITY_DN3812_c0_g1~~TRINITY_DN3812_c0_g1_i3.p1  ORF type:complete len:290 (+),score=62.53 TRINITY_DN3812_c0_g1_i3:282-1151(+)